MKKISTSLSVFLNILENQASEHKQRQVLYRGHSKQEYSLQPSVFRTKKWQESEHLMLRQLLVENPHEFEGDRSTFDKLVRAQHYGLPTRLLDVSTNPLVALYFACCSNPASAGDVITISSSKQRHKFFDSDAVSLSANLSFLKRSERTELLEYARKNIPASITAEARVEKFKDCSPLDRLIQTVRIEKPHFRPEVDPFDLAYVWTVTPKKAHERIKAQEGQFLLFGITEENTGSHFDYLNITEIEVPAASKASIMEELELVGISRRTLFPEISSSAEQIKQRYS